MSVRSAARRLRDATAPFACTTRLGPARYILNPLDYAWAVHERYCARFAPRGHRVKAVLVGMNPGPWGMAQTGVPFGSPEYVSSFLGLTGRVRTPQRMHPKRPVRGFDSPRTEVSGQRLWGGIQQCFGTPEKFFADFYIANYCPLAFQSETGANVTPDKLPAAAWKRIQPHCDAHLLAVVRALKPDLLIGVGKWAQTRAREVFAENDIDMRVGTILHPSPASPAANRGWLTQARAQLADLGAPWPAPRR